MNSKTLFFSAVVAAFVGSTCSADPIPDEYKQNGFAIGAQAYTFNRFSAFEAIEKTAQAGGKVIEFFPGQKLTKDGQGNLHHNNAGDDVIGAAE